MDETAANDQPSAPDVPEPEPGEPPTRRLESDLDYQFDSLEWFHAEYVNGRMPDCAGQYVALCGHRVLAIGPDGDTVEELAHRDPAVVPSRVVVTYASIPID
jgi:hypothetical protein